MTCDLLIFAGDFSDLSGFDASSKRSRGIAMDSARFEPTTNAVSALSGRTETRTTWKLSITNREKCHGE
jgi:hypothetical protein